MLEQERVHTAVTEAFVSTDRRLWQVRTVFERGLITKAGLRDQTIKIAQDAEASLSETIYLICDEENISWDQAEWNALRENILSSCRLKPVPYEYHPADLGFNELTESMYIFECRLVFLEELFLHPDPVGETFQMKLKLENGDDFAWVDYLFNAKGISTGTGKWEGYRIFDGHGSFPGYSGEASIHITERCGALRSVLFQKTYPQSGDPVWQKRKAETAVGYRYELME